jgi:hypothetical protein
VSDNVKVFVVPLIRRGNVEGVRAFTTPEAAQACFRHYVGFDTFLERAKRKRSVTDAEGVELEAYSLAEESEFAGTFVYEAQLEA